ncbi:hypothetical protein DD238_003954 [Peronospora effusa]|uniref:tRNA uridine(34) hydroxylase N-terminal domain-containing protein n=1 Tax=Peronospora effusa TaxID=542832 RepID=A0A3M6VNV0_9STRA|nr:hypothetical protein DD238_003954 [Peronospora effusa]
MLLRCLEPLYRPFRRWALIQSDCLESRRYVSLYNYVAFDESELPKLRRRLPSDWKALGVSRRVDLSSEKINGQVELPQYHVTTLSTSFPTGFIRRNMFYGHLQSCTNADHPFFKSTVKLRKQVVHDSFQGEELSLQNSDRSLPATTQRQQQATCWMPAIPNALSKYVSKRPQASLARNSHTRHFTASKCLYKHIGNCELQTAYVYGQSSSLADEALLRDLRVETTRNWPKAEQVIDEMQGKFLSFLVQTTKAQRVLEIGCFTGYSALCIANGLAADGSLVTCDIDSAAMQFAQSFFDKSSHADQITAVNQDGLEYLKTAALSISAKQQPFDLIFVDANKCKYRAYYDFILEHKVLHPSGLLVFDNTLFHGRVAACAHGLASSKERIAHSLTDFNHYVAQDVRTTQVIVPLWDGLTLIQYNKKETIEVDKASDA